MKKTLREDALSEDLVNKINQKIDKTYKIALPTHLKNIPAFPADVTSISSEEVGRLLAAYDSEVAYIRGILANVEVQLNHARYVIGIFKKKLFLEHRSEVGIQDANAWVDINKDVVEAENALHDIEAEQALVQARLDIFSKYSASISREISRRKQEFFGGTTKISGEEVKTSDQEERIKQIKGKEFVPKRKV